MGRHCRALRHLPVTLSLPPPRSEAHVSPSHVGTSRHVTMAQATLAQIESLSVSPRATAAAPPPGPLLRTTSSLAVKRTLSSAFNPWKKLSDSSPDASSSEGSSPVPGGPLRQDAAAGPAAPPSPPSRRSSAPSSAGAPAPHHTPADADGLRASAGAAPPPPPSPPLDQVAPASRFPPLFLAPSGRSSACCLEMISFSTRQASRFSPGGHDSSATS